jgi:hypothetical protein
MLMEKKRSVCLKPVIIAAALVMIGTVAAERAEDFVAIDVETLEFVIDQGTGVADRIPNAYVGELSDDMLIGVAVPQEDGPYHDAGDVIVYICDSTTLAAWFYTTSTGDDMVIEFQDITVDLVVLIDQVMGTVVIGDGEPKTFTARAATNTSGLFAGDATFDSETYRGGWIVLEDGRQAGWLSNLWMPRSAD